MRANASARTCALLVAYTTLIVSGCRTTYSDGISATSSSDTFHRSAETLTKDRSLPLVANAASTTRKSATVGVTDTSDTKVVQASGETIAPGSTAPLTLADLERLALANNPTLVQAATYVDAARGKATQAGLPFNPTIGMEAEQIGADHTSGEVRWFTLQQEIVLGGKLRLSRMKYEKEAYLAEVQAQAQRLKVVNGMTIAYFAVLAGQREVENDRQLLKNSEEAVKTTEQMLNVGQANQQDLLQAQVDAQQVRVVLHKAESHLRQQWIHLVTVIGVPTLALQPLEGNLETDSLALQREECLAKLLQESPELMFATGKVQQDQIQLQREKREPIPNLVVRGGVGYNFETRNNTADAAFGIKLPIFDRNQGTITQATADLMRSQAEVCRVELDLQRRFADEYARYEIASMEVASYRNELLPNSRKTYELYAEQLKSRRAAYPQVLVAQRTMLQLNDEYTRALLDYRRAEVEIRGLLLIDGLNTPSTATPAGHINATPKPR